MLAVGDSTELEIIFKSGKYKNRVSKRPRIETNEGAQDKHVQITSFVVERPDSTKPLVLQPYKLDLSQFSEKVIDEKTFTITNVSEQKVRLEVVYLPQGLFDVELPSVIGAGQSADARLKLSHDAHGESFEKSVTIEATNVDDDVKTRFTIPVKRTLKLSQSNRPATRKLPDKDGSGG